MTRTGLGPGPDDENDIGGVIIDDDAFGEEGGIIPINIIQIKGQAR